MQDWLQYLIELPPSALIILKMTVLLAVGWFVHFCLAQRNPRWRVLVWRGVMVGVLVLPFAELMLPKFGVAVVAPAPISSPVVTSRAIEPISVSEPVSEVLIAPQAAPVAAIHEPVVAERVRVWSREHAIQIGFATWVVIALLLLTRTLFALENLRRLLAHTQAAPASLRQLLSRIADALRGRRQAQLRVIERTTSPFLAGFVRPVIVIPERMTEENFSDDLPAVFAHELAHLNSRDPVWMAITKGLSAVLWFHPLVWRIRSAHAAACEAVCDAVAAEYVGGTTVYASSLARVALELATAEPVFAGVPMLRTAEITRRLRRLKNGVRAAALSRPWVMATVIAGAISLTILGGVTLVRAEPSAHQAERKPSVESAEKVDEIGSVSIKVVDSAGNPVRGAAIIADEFGIASAGSQRLWRGDRWGIKLAKTDDRGMARLSYPLFLKDSVRTDVIKLRVRHPDFALATVDSYPVDGRGKPVVVEQGAKVRITVRSASGETIGSSIDARTMSKPGLDRFAWSSVHDGTFVGNLPAGHYDIQFVRVPDGGQALFSDALGLDLEKNKEYTREVVLKPGSRVRGKVDKPGAAKGTVYLAIFPPKADKETEHLLWEAWTSINEDGSFEFKSVPAGNAGIVADCSIGDDYYVSANPPGFEEDPFARPQEFVVTGDVTDVNLKLRPAASCDVQVEDSAGQPVKGALIRFATQDVVWRDGIRQRFDGPRIGFSGIAYKRQEEFAASEAEYPGVCMLNEQYLRDVRTDLEQTLRSDRYTDIYGQAHLNLLLPGLHKIVVAGNEYELAPEQLGHTEPASLALQKQNSWVELKPGWTAKATLKVVPKLSELRNDKKPQPVSDASKTKETRVAGFGEAVDGLRMYIAAHKKVWANGEIPRFRVDALVVGPGTLGFPEPPQGISVEVDGVVYIMPTAAAGSAGFPPARSSEHWRGFTLDGKLLVDEKSQQPLVLTPGTHKVRFRIFAKAKDSPEGTTVYSNAVEIKIVEQTNLPQIPETPG